MVKTERSFPAPASLEIESKKKNGSYREADVIAQLKADFNNKCYLCELNDPTDIEVDHLRPHHGRKIPERVFDWSNLFFSCRHCNSMKNVARYDDKIIDCCAVDPETVLNHICTDGKVTVTPVGETPDETAIMTADLLTACFENKNTGIRTNGCQARYDRLSATMNALYDALGKYKKSSRHKAAIRGMLKREYKFAAFTRYYVRSHLEDYPEFKEYVS